jgi:hypothetical protein
MTLVITPIFKERKGSCFLVAFKSELSAELRDLIKIFVDNRIPFDTVLSFSYKGLFSSNEIK